MNDSGVEATRPHRCAPDYVIVGGGQAGRRAAEELRKISSTSEILLVGDEAVVPYDRPLLSKQVLLAPEGESDLFIRNATFYADLGIELLLNTRVTHIHRNARHIELANGDTVGYGALLLATGSRPRTLSCPVDLDAEVNYLRSISDARLLRKSLQSGRSVVILGGGFIGLEVAASAVARGCDVTLVEPNEQLLQRSMPTVVGARIMQLHCARGVRFLMGKRPRRIGRGRCGSLLVDVDDGQLTADVVVAGVGAQPNIELAARAGLNVDNGIVVDDACRTNDRHIFAAGDVTSHYSSVLRRHVRIESWQVAENQPVIAAANMTGGELRYEEIPWLWTDQYDWNVQTLGMFDSSQEWLVRGDPDAGEFSVYGVGRDGKLEALASVNRGRDVALARRLMKKGIAIDLAKMRDPEYSLSALLN
jgi:anthranilate 1,2-dioxygenase ferredoxin reductase component